MNHINNTSGKIMKNTRQYRFYSDAGHGWFAVKRSELEALQIAQNVSSYSYQRGDTVYLEEDCDMPLFFNAKGWKNFDAVYQETGKIVKDSYTERSPIRSYDSYTY